MRELFCFEAGGGRCASLARGARVAVGVYIEGTLVVAKLVPAVGVE